MLPEWTKDLIRVDLAKQGYGSAMDFLSVSDAQIEAWFRARNLNVTWYVDTASGGGQVFGAQAAGAILPFPTKVEAYFFVEGSFLFLDGGTLDLGLVRDSTLNSTNDYQIFAETFETVAHVGVESLKINMTVTPDGTAAPAASAAV